MVEGGARPGGSPLAELPEMLSRVLERRVGTSGRWVQGIQGPVGSGKSTLVGGLAQRLSRQGIPTAILSLDDLYRPYSPDGPGRGPPGSHDVGAGVRVLEAFRAGEGPLSLPRFDKAARDGAGDRVEDEVVGSPRILLFEGWFLGCSAAPGYGALWGPVDDLWVVRAPGEAQIREWRHQAEEGRRRAGHGLSVEEVDALLDRMLGALPPALHGAVTPPPGDPRDPPETVPPTSLVVDLDARRRVVRVRAAAIRVPPPRPLSPSDP